MAMNIGLDCLKFSHATGMTAEGAIAWTHFTAPGLHLAIRSGASDELMLQLILGNDVMESIDIGALVDRAMQARHGSQQAGVTAQIEQLPIFGIAKDALLALRYRLPDGQARRLQFRLPGAEQCSQIVKVFRDRGMEFQEQRPRTARPGTARSGTASSSVRPATGQSVTSTYFPSAQIHNNLSAAPPASSSDANVTQPSNQTVSHDAHNQSIFRPSPLPASWDSTALAKHTVPPPSSHPPRSEARYTHAPATSLHVPPASQSLGLLPSPMSEPNAPISILDLPDTLEHELPPRRELPFKRPGSQQTNSSRPVTAAPPTRASLGAAARPSTANPLKRVHEQEDVYARPATSMMLGNVVPLSTAPASIIPAITAQRIAPQQQASRRPSNIGELLRNRLPRAESHGNKMLRVSSLVDAPHEIDTPPTSSSSKAVQGYDPSARLMATVQAPIDRTLQEYAAQSSEDRKAAMDEFIVSRLEDANFATLCENVDQCWRRIALGL
ncbi:hypothetical protein LTR95_000985 [Oleoguttula sp. CCFEE 5521]